jgi:hypothetical protein
LNKKPDVFVEFNFNNSKTIATSIIPNEKNPKWDLKETFELTTDTQKIQTSLLLIV